MALRFYRSLSHVSLAEVRDKLALHDASIVHKDRRVPQILRDGLGYGFDFRPI